MGSSENIIERRSTPGHLPCRALPPAMSQNLDKRRRRMWANGFIVLFIGTSSYSKLLEVHCLQVHRFELCGHHGHYGVSE